MKVEEKEVEVPKPPALVVLTMTQEEAGALWRFVNYYSISTTGTADVHAAASRCTPENVNISTEYVNETTKS